MLGMPESTSARNRTDSAAHSLEANNARKIPVRTPTGGYDERSWLFSNDETADDAVCDFPPPSTPMGLGNCVKKREQRLERRAPQHRNRMISMATRRSRCAESREEDSNRAK